MKLTLQNNGEAFIINLDSVLYFEADDHYTHVFMAEGNKFLVPFGLASVEQSIAALSPVPKDMVRIGRRYVVNMERVFHINILRQTVLLADKKGAIHSLQVSKAVARYLLEAMNAGKE